MKNRIRFSEGDKQAFIRELRSSVNNYFETNKLSKYGGASLVTKTLIMFAIYLVPLALMLTGVTSNIFLMLLSWVIMGFGMAGVGMGVMHDANHKSFSKSNKVNNLFSLSLVLLGGFPPNWKYQHNTLHHGFTNIDGHDEDLDSLSFLRFSPHKPLFKIHRLQQFYVWFFYGFMTFSWITAKDFIQISRYGVQMRGRKTQGRFFSELLLSKIVYYSIFLILPMVILPVAWYWTLLFFSAMHYTAGFILSVIFQTAHVVSETDFPVPDENGQIENDWAIHQLATTADFSPKSKLFSWYIGGLNYQIEHHLFPNISHVHYRDLSRLVRDLAAKYEIPYKVHQSFFSAIASHYRMLRNLGRQGA